MRTVSVLIVLAVLTSAVAADMTIVENGQPQATIVLGAEHSATDEWCAQELQTYIKKITGAELPILTDDQEIAGVKLPNVLAVSNNRFTESLYEIEYDIVPAN